jgi:hypothetical protein
MISVSVVVWAVLAFVAILLGVVASCFSLRTLRWVSVFTVLFLAGGLTRYGLTHPENGNTDLVSAFTSGVDRVIQALLQPLWRGHQVPPPGAIGRLILAISVVLGYRGLEWWALRRQAPMLDLSALGDGQPNIEPAGRSRERRLTEGQQHDQLTAELKFRLCAMEIRAPSILPGGSRTNALASIAEDSGVGGAGLAGAIIRFAGTLWPNPRRLALHVWVEPPDKAADPPASANRVTVDLDEPRTGATIASKTVAGTDINEATCIVAGYVGRQMFAMDRTTPQWCYGAADGRDLASMLLARLERVSAESAKDVETARQVRIRRLWQPGNASRAAGVVRYELAQLLNLDNRDLDSLRLHAMNREEYPRFYRGRYRLAMSLQMISNPDHEPFGADTEASLDEILKVLCRCGMTSKAACVPGDVTALPSDRARRRLSASLRMELLNIAARELRDVRRQLTMRRVLWATLVHRDERTIWVPHWGLRQRQAFHDGVCVAELLVAVRQSLVTREPREPSEARGSGDGQDPAADTRFRHLWHASRVTAAVAGDCAFARWIGAESKWAIVRLICTARDKAQSPGPVTGKAAHPAGRDRVRWLPWLRRTASWQASYNTACLYAALAGITRAGDEQRLTYQDRVLVSLERAINNPLSEMERAHDWIARDPDFTVLKNDKKRFKLFDDFLSEQELRDYPRPYRPSAPQPASDAGEPVAGDPLARYIVPAQAEAAEAAGLRPQAQG